MRPKLACLLPVLLFACAGSHRGPEARRDVPLPPIQAHARPSPALLRRGGPRVALVLGNGAYLSSARLRNPTGDAQAIAQKLRELGFKTTLLLDQGRLGIERGLRDFTRSATSAELALLFYAGHGLQAGSRNYLVPIDAHLEHEADIPYEAIDVQNLLEDLQTRAQVGLIFLDACRDNPLVARAVRGITRGLGRGLAPMESSHGELLLVYATSPGRTAEDGRGEHSPFTQALLEHLGTPQVEVQILLKRVIRDVAQLTADQQVPWQSSSLRSEVYLNGTPTSAPPQLVPSAALVAPPDLPQGMTRIPGGAVRIDPSHDGERTGVHRSDEPSARTQEVRAYLLDLREVSVADYGTCVKAGRCSMVNGDGYEACNEGKDRERHPQNCVTLQQSRAYCAFVGKRLPTEDEWALAAHGTAGRRFPWGAGPLLHDEACWLRRTKGTCEVGSAPLDRSPEGVMDLGGNVAEWTESRSACCAAKDSHGPCAEPEHVVRGASYASMIPVLWRGHRPAGRFDAKVGFRCARDP